MTGKAGPANDFILRCQMVQVDEDVKSSSIKSSNSSSSRSRSDSNDIAESEMSQRMEFFVSLVLLIN